MEYKNYHRDIVVRYQIELVGWPHSKFQSPGSLGTSLPLFVSILDALESGECRFVELTPEALETLDVKYRADVAAGIIAGPAKRKKRSDEGITKKRKGRDGSSDDDSDNINDEADGRRQRRKTVPSDPSDHSNVNPGATGTAAETTPGPIA